MKQVLLFILTVFSLQAFAQQQLVQERKYKVDGFEKEINASAINGQGNILFSGSSFTLSSSEFKSSFLLIKPNTDTLWTRKGINNLYFPYNYLRPTHSGDFIFVSTAQNPNYTSVSGILLQKINANAVPVWIQTNLYSNTINIPTSLLVTPDKGFLVGGKFKGQGYSLLKTDSLGNQKWLKNFTHSSWDVLRDMQYTKNGDIITAGLARSISTNTWNLRLLLVNQQGDSLKGNKIIVMGTNRQEGMNNNFNSITPLSDGGYLLTAYIDTATSAIPYGLQMGMIVKVDNNLNLKWKYIHRTPTIENYAFTRIKELQDSTILVLGFKYIPAQGGNGFQIYHFSKKGNLLATIPFTSSICSQVWGITFDALNDSTYMIGGRCGNNPPITYGFYVAKVKLPGLAQPMPQVLPGSVTSIAEETNKPELYLGQSYPNPTSSEVTIPYNLPKNFQQAKIIVRELATGREIKSYDLKRSSNSLNINVSNFSNGLYLYSLIIDEEPIATKKLAVMK